MTITITEVENNPNTDLFFKMIQNFELNIALTKDINSENATTYYEMLEKKMNRDRMKHVDFCQFNKFFLSAL